MTNLECFLSHILDWTVIHAVRQAMMHARGLLASVQTIYAQIAHSGWCWDVLPVPSIRVALFQVEGTVLQHHDTGGLSQIDLFAKCQLEMVLASDLAGVAVGAILVID